MKDEEVLEKYGDTPLHFSHYYNFLFIFKSEVLESGEQIFLQLGGTMEKVSAMVIDANDPMILFYLSKFLPYKTFHLLDK